MMIHIMILMMGGKSLQTGRLTKIRTLKEWRAVQVYISNLKREIVLILISK